MIKQRVSDLITIDIVRNWTQGNIITITAGTGAGKSYWTKNILYYVAKEQNKQILFLIHRSNCKDQFYEELKKANKLDTITLMTYQTLEAYYMKNNKPLDISQYDYIVCDEFHYFISDASFNKATDISLDTILNYEKAIKVFMSATGDIVEKYLKNYKQIQTINYNLDIDYKFISSLVFFNKDETIEYIIDKILNTNNKAIVFIQSAEKAYRLFSKYKDKSIFNCSKHNDKYYKHVNKELINDILINECFDKQILITTTCMDAGVNLIDTDIKYIITDVKDIRVLKQCIGRKRIQNSNDTFKLFIKAYNNNILGGLKTQISKRIEKAEYFISHNINEYIDKYFKDHDRYDIVYDINIDNGITKKLNELMYFKSKIDISEIEDMLEYKTIGFIKYLAKQFNRKDDYIIMEDAKNNVDLKTYLENIIGVKLLKEQQKELIDRIDLKVNGRQQKSYNKLNEGLKMLKLPYIILPKKTDNIRYWIIEKIEE